jgi:hypothetical membrane protein
MSHSAQDIADHTPHAGEKSGLRIPLLVCGIVAGPLFFAIFLIAGALRPDYDPLRHPVSSLEFGPTGWVQSVNFILTGTLVVLFGLGIRSTVRKLGGGRTVPILFMVVGAGLIGAGLFAPDPLSGYPPGTPPAAVSPSLHRVLHDLFSTPVFTALPAACIILARRFAKCRRIGWAIYSALSAAMMIILFVMSGIAFAQGSPFTPIGGLLQRLTLAVGFLWMALLGLWSLMTPTSR